MKIDIGISAKDRKKIADGLSHLLADTYTLYLKTHNFHWNVTGPMFNSLHTMFMTQYTELWLSLDEIAERIRALDYAAPGSGAQYAKLSSIKEETGVPDWKDMVQQLVFGHEACAAPPARPSRSPTTPTTSRPRTCRPSACRPTKRTPGCCVRCCSKGVPATFLRRGAVDSPATRRSRFVTLAG